MDKSYTPRLEHKNPDTPCVMVGQDQIRQIFCSVKVHCQYGPVIAELH